MIVLDTDVLSALMLERPDRQVVDWLNSQADEALWTTTVTLFELRFGIEYMPAGRRRTALETAFDRNVSMFGERVLVLDVHAAMEAARIMGQRRTAGRPVDIRDTLIAGIAVSRQAAIATRNAHHFDDLPITVVNPWAA